MQVQRYKSLHNHFSERSMGPMLSFLHHLSVATIFGLLGNIISFMVYLSPIPTFYQICKRRSSEGYQCVPYVVALFSSTLWILYALYTPDSVFLKTINSFGIFIETIYIAIFLVYATRRGRIATAKLFFAMNVVGFGVIVFTILVIAKTNHIRVKILGWINLIFSLCVFAAPLGVVRQVIRTKSVKYMPFLLSFFLTISAVAWFFYGFVRKDYYVAIPNVIGFSFGIAQMGLYAKYSSSNKLKEDASEKKEFPNEPTVTHHHIIELVKVDPMETQGQVEVPHLGLDGGENN